MTTWDPDRYLTYADERGRAFVDLVARVAADSPRRVVDLGCGPGNLTRLLVDRWPRARVLGVDSSAEMVDRARADQAQVAGLDFERADLRDWLAAAGEAVDVLLSNATLQWVPGHLALLPDLVGRLAPAGWLAFQVPRNFAGPSHAILRELAAEAPYADHTAGVAFPAAHDAATYLQALRQLGCEVDAWETTYLHVLTGDDAVFTWVSGTGARPTLAALPEGLRMRFESEYRRRLHAAYPPEEEGTVFPFRRVFVVARIPG